MDKEKTYPISEIFISPQGEGQYTGVLMAFIRLSGCTVGKPYPKEVYQQREEQTFVGLETMPPQFPIYTEKCTLYDGREFACDTDYRVKERLTVKEILKRIPEDIKHFCITGGEPFIHNLEELNSAANERQVMVHVETSGTISHNKAFPTINTSGIWITVSPKLGVLPEVVLRADEIKLLVDDQFDPQKLIPEIANHHRVYIQPVNFEHTVNCSNLKKTMEWQKRYPNWRVSLQLHKVISHFINERIL